jgi:hypothetical protein
MARLGRRQPNRPVVYRPKAAAAPVGAVYRDGVTYDSAGTSVVTFTRTTPGTVAVDDVGLLLVTWVGTSGETPPTVAAESGTGNGWSTVLPPRTSGNMGTALLARVVGASDSATVTVTLGNTRLVTAALAWYSEASGTGVVGTPFDRPASQATTTATGLTAGAAGRTVLLAYAERTVTAGTTVSLSAGTQRRYVEGTGGTDTTSLLADLVAAGTATGDVTATYSSASANGVGVQVELLPTGGAVPVGQTSETDLAQSITRRKIPTVGQAVETDLAQTATRRKIQATGQPVEADAAQPVGRVRRRTLGEPAETDVAQPVTVRPFKIQVGQAAETDTAAAVGRRKARAVGQAAETQQAQAVTARKVRAVGAAAESDAAQTVSRAHRRAVGQPAETDLAQPVGRRKMAAVGQASELDTARPVTLAGGSHIVGQAAEADVARSLARAKQRTLGQAAEADTAAAVGRRKQAAVGRATEADTATAVARTHRRTLGQPGDIETAAALARRHVAVLGQAAETDTARRVTGAGLHVAVGQALELDTAQPLRVRNYVHRPPTTTTMPRAGSGTVGRAGSGTVPRP